MPPRSRSACRRACAGSPGSGRSGRRTRCARARSRSRASSAACAIPTACAAIPMRPPSSVASAIRIPCAGRAEQLAGRVLEREVGGRGGVQAELLLLAHDREARRAGAHDDKRPGRCPASRAKTSNVAACEPLVIHCLAPVMPAVRDAAAHRAGVRAGARTRSARTLRSPRPPPAAGRAARPARACRARAAAACTRSCARRPSRRRRRPRAPAPRARARRRGSRRPRRRAPPARRPPSGRAAELAEQLARERVLAVPAGRLRARSARPRSAPPGRGSRAARASAP